jgi:hypothetical protein
MKMDNPYAHLTEGLRPITLKEAAKAGEYWAWRIRAIEQAAVLGEQIAEPRLIKLREADAIEMLTKVAKILSLDEPSARAFMEKLKVMRG